MGPVRRRRGNPVHYDPELFENWNTARLKEELSKKGIRIPQNARRMSLVRLLRAAGGETPAVRVQSLFGSARNQTTGTPRVVNNGDGGRSQNATRQNENNNDHRVLIDLVSKVSATVQSLQQNVTRLTSTVNTLLAERSQATNNQVTVLPAPIQANAPVLTATNELRVVQPTQTSLDIVTANERPSFTLESAYKAMSRPSAAAGSAEQLTRNAVRTSRGYAAESLPYVETVSEKLRRSIISGNDVNLAALLIPYYSGSGIQESTCNYNYSGGDNQNLRTDQRLNRSLSLAEFIQAFGTYKSIMCQTHPHRREELDAYERDIVDMASRYPGRGFYEYHKQFSAQAAAHATYNNIPIDWSIRNNTLFCNIFTNARPNACNHCGSPFHFTAYCNQSSLGLSSRQTQGARSFISDQDTYGRERVFYMGREICNNFNGQKGCVNTRCKHAHICLLCKGDHNKSMCQVSKNEAQGPQRIGTLSQRKI